MININKILCMIEADNHSIAALQQSKKIASAHQADITFASVLKFSGSQKTFFQNQQEFNLKLKQVTDNKRIEIQKWLSENDCKENNPIEIHSGIGFVETVRSVIKNQYDLVIKCADDVDWLEQLFGSDDMHLLRKCPCPVLMLKPSQKETFKNILATVDINDEFDDLDEYRVQDNLNKKVLDYSAIFAASELSELHIGGAWEAYGEDFLRHGAFSHLSDDKVDFYTEQTRRECTENMDLLIANMKSTLGDDSVKYLQPKVHLVKGKPAKEIPQMAKKYAIDLVIMGTVARTGIPGFVIGNTAESILQQVKCSILAIKPDGFISPVEMN
ncbi:universal stress protein [Aliiglaciecola sp. LCG003]|uniref:universal stress protein n=1 Tax=Aliiglaciecola sp. LCG003 TaxID=3053655 RepID=UPI00257460ED|nr:universal stress protein [Aliiglaciecola sp. LCG003]WJG07619.1 universal stress protein [Aliiglaciecola sp. LCG003]